MTPILRIEHLHVALPKGADRAYAVEDVSLDLAPNEILCVVGESGSGKSLTARAVMGLLPAPHVRVAKGSIYLGDEDVTKLAPKRLRQVRGGVASMIFQEPMTALNPLMTIGRQIDEAIRTHARMDKKARRERVLAMLADVGLPEPERLIGAYPHELSGGQRQRAMIAMALVLEPKVLIADEPTTALDVTTQAQILKLIKGLQAEHGTGVLFITHDFGVVAEIADRVAVMEQGRVVETGPAAEVLDRPRHPYTRALIAAVPALAPRKPRPVASEPLMKVEGLVKIYKKRGLFGGSGREVRAVDEIGFTLQRGETLGIVGESGSGKSTVARCLVRLLTPDAGRIDLDGTDLASLSRGNLRPWRRRVQMVFQDPYASLNPRRRIGRIVAEGPIAQGTPQKDALKDAHELLELVGLDAAAAERYPHEFSGGQRQRVGVARALALKPDILVADEPVSALDVSIQAQILELLDDLRARFSLSMLFITHDLRVAAQVCDRIAVMQFGKIVEQGPTAAVFADPQHAYTQQLLAAVPGRDWRSSPIEEAIA